MAILHRDVESGRWVPGPFLNDIIEKNIFSIMSGGRGHTFNYVSGVIYVFLVQLYENYVSAFKKYIMQMHYLVFAKKRLCVSKKGKTAYEKH